MAIPAGFKPYVEEDDAPAKPTVIPAGFKPYVDDEDLPNFKSGEAYAATKALMPSDTKGINRFLDRAEMIRTIRSKPQSSWSDGEKDIMNQYNRSEVEKLAAVTDFAGAIPGMAVGGIHGIYDGIKNFDFSKGFKTAQETAHKLTPTTLMGEGDVQSSDAYKNTSELAAPLTDTIAAPFQGYGEVINAAGFPKAAEQVNAAGQTLAMAGLGYAGARSMFKGKKGANRLAEDEAQLAKLQEDIANAKKPPIVAPYVEKSTPEPSLNETYKVPSSEGSWEPLPVKSDLPIINRFGIPDVQPTGPMLRKQAKEAANREATQGPQPEALLPELPMEEVPSRIMGEDPLKVNAQLPDVNFDPVLRAGWEEGQKVQNEGAPVTEYPLSPEAIAKRAQADAEARYQNGEDFNNGKPANGLDGGLTEQFMKAQQEARDTAQKAAEQKAKDDAHAQHEAEQAAEIERQRVAMEAAQELQTARDAGEINYHKVVETGDKSLMPLEDSLKMLDFLREGNIGGALTHIAENHPRGAYRALAKFLSTRLSDVTTVLHPEEFLHKDGKAHYGYFDGGKNELGFSLRGGVSAHTVLHEAVHALTAQFMRDMPTHPLSRAVAKLYNQISTLKGFDKFAASIPDVYEFVSESHSNPALQSWLKNQNNISFWGKLKNIYKKMMGVPLEMESALDHAMDIGKQIMEFSTPETKMSMMERFREKGFSENLSNMMAASVSDAATKIKDIVPDLNEKGEVASVEELREKAKAQDDISPNLAQRFFQQLTSGGLWESLKTDNILIKTTYEVMSRSIDRGNELINIHLKDKDYGMINAYRALDRQSLAKVTSTRIIADAAQFELTTPYLEKLGFTPKEIKATMIPIEAMKAALKSMNEARARAGKKPVDARLGYAVAQMTGDFRKIISERKLGKDGKEILSPIGMIGHDRRRGLARIEAAIRKEHPEWHISDEKYVGRGSKKDATSSRTAAMHDALQWLADESPQKQELMKVLKDTFIGDAYDYRNAKKHTMSKKGIFGSEGKKAWVDDYTNASEFAKGEVLYAETMFKWAELSKGVSELAPMMADVAESQKNAHTWSEAYIDKAMGINSTFMAKTFDSLLGYAAKTTGIGSSHVINSVRLSKGMTNTVLLGLNQWFLTVNALQPVTGLPKIKALLVSRGLDLNMDFGTGGSYMHRGLSAMMKEKNMLGFGKLSQFEADALAYGKKNSIFGSELLDHSTQINKDTAYYASKISGAGVNAVESGTNKVAFLSISHMLQDSGMKVHEGLYETAFKLTKMIMHDYRAHESARVFDHLGAAGTLAKNLTKYKMGEASQLAFFVREMQHNKSTRPLVTYLTVSMITAGVMGTMYFNVADQLYQLITDLQGQPDTLRMATMRNADKLGAFLGKQVTGMGYENAGKAIQEHLPETLSHGGISHVTGVDLVQRMGSGNAIPEHLLDAVAPGVGKTVDMVGAVVRLAKDPNMLNTKRAVREVSPGIVAGLEDAAWFTTPDDTPGGPMGFSRKPTEKGRNFQGKFHRNEKDTFIKKMGATSVRESKAMDVLWQHHLVDTAYKEKQDKIASKLVDAYINSGFNLPASVVEQAKKDFINADGKVEDFVAHIVASAKGAKLDMVQQDRLSSALGHPTRILRRNSMNEPTMKRFK